MLYDRVSGIGLVVGLQVSVTVLWRVFMVLTIELDWLWNIVRLVFAPC